MKRNLVALVAGALFSVGLSLAGMTRPSKVLAFLDLFGHWDPSLALVMVGAIAVSAVAFRVSSRLASPALDTRFHAPPEGGAVGPRLLLGAATFGVGWGLSGLCPGPAVASLVSGNFGSVVFVGSMLAGMALHARFADAKPVTSREGWRASSGTS